MGRTTFYGSQSDTLSEAMKCELWNKAALAESRCTYTEWRMPRLQMTALLKQGILRAIEDENRQRIRRERKVW